MNATGGDIRDVTHGYWHDGTGAPGDGIVVYSPDGTQIMFSSDRGGYDSRAWIIRSDGTHLRELSPQGAGESGGVDWSPDGSQILGGAVAHSCCVVFTIHPDGTGYHVIREGAFVDGYSPDGSKILVEPFDSALSIMNADGTGSHVVSAELPSGATGAAWAPR